MLQKINAPDCPNCGCNYTVIAGAGERHGKAWARFECDFCGCVFSIGQPARIPGTVNGVVYNTIKCKCPKCDSENPPVRSTQGRIRYHKCGNCGQDFKSVEAK